MTYFYVCDNCGSIADISVAPHSDSDEWACADCDSQALWEFTDREKAQRHAFHIQDARHAAEMAKLDQALARLDELEGQAP